jgi:hypothetical protein
LSGPSRRELLGGLAGLGLLSAAPAPPSTTLPRLAGSKGISADIALFQRAYETLHPGLWRYQTPGEWADRIARLSREATAATTPQAFWTAFARATAGVRCGHSYVNPYNQEGAWETFVATSRTRLPFSFRWINREMVVLERAPAHLALVPGARVSTLATEADVSLIRRMLPLARADGHNEAKALMNMSVPGTPGQIDNFDLMWLADVPEGGPVRLLVEAPRAEPALIDVPLLSQAEVRPPSEPRDAAPGWTVRHEGDATILTMPGWALYNSSWDWKAFIDSSVDDAIARGSTRLVVDLRGNEGGLDCGDWLIARLVDRPFAMPGWERRVRFRTVPADLIPHLDTWDRSFDRLGVDARGPDSQGFYTLPPSGREAIAPRGKCFAGRLFVLTDPDNSSATFGFAQAVQSGGLGQLVGEPTGGNQRGINGGAFYFFRLPESGLEVDLPLIGTFPPRPAPDAGLLPDIPAPTTRASLFTGRDPAMEAALKA